mmetsp:Transcript_39720/g.73201  ORF Transcript_39720/g.73201 Transcript_39720/m.73201 type:complete len:424 (-) Transcript_39720:657-1928(-)
MAPRLSVVAASRHQLHHLLRRGDAHFFQARHHVPAVGGLPNLERGPVLALGVRQQVEHGLVVDLKVRQDELKVVLLRPLSLQFEQLFDAPKVHAAVVWRPVHRKRFPAASLSVREDAHVVAVQEGRHERAHVGEHRHLLRGRLEHLVELKLGFGHGVFGDYNVLVGGECGHVVALPALELRCDHGPAPRKHANVALQLDQLVVHLLALLVLLEVLFLGLTAQSIRLVHQGLHALCLGLQRFRLRLLLHSVGLQHLCLALLPPLAVELGHFASELVALRLRCRHLGAELLLKCFPRRCVLFAQSRHRIGVLLCQRRCASCRLHTAARHRLRHLRRLRHGGDSLPLLPLQLLCRGAHVFHLLHRRRLRRPPLLLRLLLRRRRRCCWKAPPPVILLPTKICVRLGKSERRSGARQTHHRHRHCCHC